MLSFRVLVNSSAIALFMLLGCDRRPTASLVRTHQPGCCYSGDSTRASPVGHQQSPPRPQLVYLELVTTPTSIAVRTSFDDADDESRADQSWLPVSLDKALRPADTPRTSIELTPLVSAGAALEDRKRVILAKLDALFAPYNVYFTATRPGDLQFAESPRYSLIFISQSPNALGLRPAPVGSYSMWDPGNQRAQEVAFVFDNASLDNDLLAGEIAHSVGHMLGLQDIDAPNTIMSANEDRVGGWSVSRLHDPFPDYVGLNPGNETLAKELRNSPFTAPAQDDDKLLSAAVGRWNDPVLLDSDFVIPGRILPPADPSHPKPYLAIGDCKLAGAAGSSVWYVCGSFGDDGTLYVTSVSVPISRTSPAPQPNSGYKEVGGGGGGGGGGTGGTGTGNNRPPNLPDHVDVQPPDPNTPEQQAMRGICRVEKFRELAKQKYEGYRAVFEPGTKLGPKETNCTNFVIDYATTIFGIALSQATINQMQNANWPSHGTLAQLVTVGDQSIQGPKPALVAAGLGTPVAELGDAIPGDIIQMWARIKGHWVGHQGIVSTFGRVDPLDGKPYYHLGLMGGHKGGIGYDKEYDIDPVYVQLGSTLSDPDFKTYIVRPGPTGSSSAGCN